METIIVIVAFFLLLLGALYLNKIWLGAVFGALLLLIFQVFAGSVTLLNSFGNAMIISLELLLLIFGAFLFYNTLKARQHFQPLIQQFSGGHAKFEVLLFFAIFFGSFLEGVAGFGIPAMLIAPILFSLGYKPLTSITVPLIANSTSVLFGALGTPLVVGLNQTNVGTVSHSAVMLNVLPILILPFMLAYVYKLIEKEDIPIFRSTPKLFATGIIYLIPFVTTSFFSIELPSVLAGIFGMIIYSSLIIPKHIRPNLGLWTRFLQPYFLFMVILITTRFFFNDVRFEFYNGAKNVSLYQPGLVFLLAITIISILRKNDDTTVLAAAKHTFYKLQKTAITIILLVLFAQLVQAPMSRALALVLSSDLNTIAAPFLGSIGSFTLGSATMSNLIFFGALNSEGVSETLLLLALLHCGSCVGNIISLQNILMVNSVVPESIKNHRVFSINMRWFLVYMGVLIVVSFFAF